MHFYILFAFMLKQNIEDSTFMKMTKMEYLSLRGNRLQKVQPAIFYPLQKLKILDITDNHIYVIDLSSINHLKVIDVSNNPLKVVKGLVIGENAEDSVFAFKNTTIASADFCVKKSKSYSKDSYVSIYVGVGHVIKCSCALIKLQPYMVGSTCIRMSTDLNHCPSMPSIDEWRCTSPKQLGDIAKQAQQKKITVPAYYYIMAILSTIVVFILCLWMAICRKKV